MKTCTIIFLLFANTLFSQTLRTPGGVDFRIKPNAYQLLGTVNLADAQSDSVNFLVSYQDTIHFSLVIRPLGKYGNGDTVSVGSWTFSYTDTTSTYIYKEQTTAGKIGYGWYNVVLARGQQWNAEGKFEVYIRTYTGCAIESRNKKGNVTLRYYGT